MPCHIAGREGFVESGVDVRGEEVRLGGGWGAGGRQGVRLADFPKEAGTEGGGERAGATNKGSHGLGKIKSCCCCCADDALQQQCATYVCPFIILFLSAALGRTNLHLHRAPRPSLCVFFFSFFLSFFLFRQLPVAACMNVPKKKQTKQTKQNQTKNIFGRCA